MCVSNGNDDSYHDGRDMATCCLCIWSAFPARNVQGAGRWGTKWCCCCHRGRLGNCLHLTPHWKNNIVKPTKLAPKAIVSFFYTVIYFVLLVYYNICASKCSWMNVNVHFEPLQRRCATCVQEKLRRCCVTWTMPMPYVTYGSKTNTHPFPHRKTLQHITRNIRTSY